MNNENINSQDDVDSLLKMRSEYASMWTMFAKGVYLVSQVCILLFFSGQLSSDYLVESTYINRTNVTALSNATAILYNTVNILGAKRPPQRYVAVFLFAGDISLDKPIRKGNGSACPYEMILSNVTEYFHNVDYNMINLEAPFVDLKLAEKSFLEDKGIHNMAWSEGVRALLTAGIKSVTVANNHITDYGSEGLRYTEHLLESYGIEVVGVTTGIEPPYSNQVPIIKTFNGVKVGILSYCLDSSGECLKYRSHVERGPALMYRETAEKDIAELRVQVNAVVLYLHWGQEYMAIPGEEQRQLAVYLSGLGVTLIVGAHPHVLQGHEWINDTLVHYSLGNFVFHPHFTMMGKLQGRADKKAIHARMMEQAKLSRGPAGYTELLMVEFWENGIKDAWYMPIQIKTEEDGCLYPRARQEDWFKVCGPEDDNCYAPRNHVPVVMDYSDTLE